MPKYLINNKFQVEDVDEDAAIARYHKKYGPGVSSIEVIDDLDYLSLDENEFKSFSEEEKECRGGPG
jgi:hypothetical protein